MSNPVIETADGRPSFFSRIPRTWWMSLLLEYGSIVAIVAILQWIAVYTWLQPWWKSHIGRSLVEFAVYAMVTPALFILSLF